MSNPSISSLAILKASKLVKDSQTAPKGNPGKSDKPSTSFPTAKARAAIDLMAGSSPRDYEDGNIPLLPLVKDLYGWDAGKQNKGTKSVARALAAAINTPGKYPHTVELAAFLSAASPLLEADAIARMFSLVNECPLAYAPNRYIMKRSRVLREGFSYYSKDRWEGLLSSLWRETHQGRWWEISMSTPAPTAEGRADYEDAANPFQDLEIAPNRLNFFNNGMEEENGALRRMGSLGSLSKFKEALLHNQSNIAFTEDNQKFLNDTPHGFLREVADDFVRRIHRGEPVNPDLATLFAGSDFLPSLSRPELTFETLFTELDEIYEDTSWDERKRLMPRRPRHFHELFPPMERRKKTSFPQVPRLTPAGGLPISINNKSALMHPVRTQSMLAQNAGHMGNCTWSYRNRMSEGTYILYLLQFEGVSYNIAVTFDLNTGKGQLREVNSRFNRGVPRVMHAFATELAKSMVLTPEEIEFIRNAQQGTKEENKRGEIANPYQI